MHACSNWRLHPGGRERRTDVVRRVHSTAGQPVVIVCVAAYAAVSVELWRLEVLNPRTMAQLLAGLTHCGYCRPLLYPEFSSNPNPAVPWPTPAARAMFGDPSGPSLRCHVLQYAGPTNPSSCCCLHENNVTRGDVCHQLSRRDRWLRPRHLCAATGGSTTACSTAPTPTAHTWTPTGCRPADDTWHPPPPRGRGG